MLLEKLIQQHRFHYLVTHRRPKAKSVNKEEPIVFINV